MYSYLYNSSSPLHYSYLYTTTADDLHVLYLLSNVYFMIMHVFHIILLLNVIVNVFVEYNFQIVSDC